MVKGLTEIPKILKCFPLEAKDMDVYIMVSDRLHFMDKG
jgi:hypothetical protein